MKILIIGASGFVGSHLFVHYSKEHEVHATYFKSDQEPQLDITDTTAVNYIFEKIKPDLVILVAAYSDVNGCETNPDKSYRINVLGPQNIANSCKSKLVFFSSDYVFDGSKGPYAETDTPNPINVYGKHKLEAEKIITKLLPSALIIRTVGIYGYDKNSKNFAMGVISNLKNRKTMHVPDDQYANPTYVQDIVKGTAQLLSENKSGVYNISGKDYCNRYEFALKIANTFDLDKSLINPVSTASLGQAALRPVKGGLKNDKILNRTTFQPSSIKEGLIKMKLVINNGR